MRRQLFSQSLALTLSFTLSLTLSSAFSWQGRISNFNRLTCCDSAAPSAAEGSGLGLSRSGCPPGALQQMKSYLIITVSHFSPPARRFSACAFSTRQSAPGSVKCEPRHNNIKQHIRGRRAVLLFAVEFLAKAMQKIGQLIQALLDCKRFVVSSGLPLGLVSSLQVLV